MKKRVRLSLGPVEKPKRKRVILHNASPCEVLCTKLKDEPSTYNDLFIGQTVKGIFKGKETGHDTCIVLENGCTIVMSYFRCYNSNGKKLEGGFKYEDRDISKEVEEEEVKNAPQTKKKRGRPPKNNKRAGRRKK